MQRKKITPFHVMNSLLLGLLAILCLLPIAHVIALSLSDSSEVASGHVALLPRGITLDAYRYVMENRQFWNAFFVTLRRVVIGVSISLILVVLTAYPLSKPVSRFHGRPFFSWFFMISMLFSGGLIPTYMVISQLGMLDTIWALTLPGDINVGFMIMMMNFFRAVPPELEDAAVIDGATMFQILRKIYLPLCRPSIAVIVLFSIVANWNGWMDGYLYMNTPDHYPLQTYLAAMLMEARATIDTMITPQQLVRMSNINAKTIECAQIFLAALPILCVYPFLQKQDTKGIFYGIKF